MSIASDHHDGTELVRRARMKLALAYGVMMVVGLGPWSHEPPPFKVLSLVLTTGLVYVTWMGRGWARVWLAVRALASAVLILCAGIAMARDLDPRGMLAFAFPTVFYATLGSVLLCSKDLRAYPATLKRLEE